MAKVIIRPNIHIDNGLGDLHKFINDQYKKYDVIVVPYYCEVYVVDGNPELKVEKPVKKSCINCKYHNSNRNDVYSCTCPDGVCGLVKEYWEAKDGNN